MNRGKWIIGLLLLTLVALLLASCRAGDIPSPAAVVANPTNPAPVGDYPSPVNPTAPKGPAPTSALPAGPVKPAPTNAQPSQPTPTGVPTAQPTQDPVRRITAAEAKSLFDAGQAILVDARAKAAYDQKHITGAISMPSGEVATRYTELPTDKQVIFYCT